MLIKIFTASFVILFASCKSSEVSSSKANDNTMNESELKTLDSTMINEGFHIGIISYQKESDCAYVIIDQTSNAKLDPINISEDTYKLLRNNGEKIYYKYRPLRRMNRCPEANPIELIDIKKRED